MLRRTLAEALSAGGQGSRDGGRTRGILLRRAAQIAHRDLGDVDKAFEWLGDALVAHVETATLDALEDLAMEVENLKRAETTIGRALAEVFDGPLVRQLLARRVKMRREKLGDKAGAAEDLKKLHDLSPADVAVMDELSVLLTELGDFKGMVQFSKTRFSAARIHTCAPSSPARSHASGKSSSRIRARRPTRGAASFG